VGGSVPFGVAFHARNAVVADLYTAVAALTGTERVDSVPALVDRVRNVPGLVRLVVDGLDEATDQARPGLVEILVNLAALPQARVVVATRRVAVGDRVTASTLLARFGIRPTTDAALVDLDAEEYFDPDGLREFAAALLRQDGSPEPSPTGGAWAVYREDAALCARLATAVANRAGTNHLVAALTADPLGHAETAVDPGAVGFDLRSLPTTVGEALDRYLDEQADKGRGQLRGLLTALAYARGPGLDDDLWLTFATTLGYPVAVMDLDTVRRGSAADYLVQSAPRPGGGTVTSLFHQALADELLTHRGDRGRDEQKILTAITPTSPATWLDAIPYAREYAADHAVAAGRLADLLVDPLYPSVADLDRLVPLLPAAPMADVAAVVAVVWTAAYRARSLPLERRARLFRLTAAHLGMPTTFSSTDPFTCRWAHTLGPVHRTLTGHTGGVHAVAVGRIDGRDVIVSGSNDRSVRVWDAVTGAPIGEPLTGHTNWVTAVALGRVDGRDVIVSGSNDRSVRVWDAVTGELTAIQDTLELVRAVALSNHLAAVVVGRAVCAFDI
jgi:hypothetical protein